MMSLTGSSCSELACGHQVGIARMSWPDFACASAAMVTRFLLPWLGDVVDRNLDLLLGGPFVDEIGRGLVGAGHPVVPEADRELAGGVSAADIGRGDQRRG